MAIHSDTPVRGRAGRRRVRGFTLVELLISSLLTAILLASIYFVFNANSRQYYTQEQVVQMQESMRFALEYLKNDLRNAGQLAVVNGSNPLDPGYCSAPNPALMGVSLDNNNIATAPDALRVNGNELTPDAVTILADGSGGTPLAAEVNGDVVTLQPSALQPSAAGVAVLSSEARFTSMFRTGYFLRITDRDNNFDLVPISEVTADPARPTLTLTRDVCSVLAHSLDVRINPVHVVRYRIADDETADPGLAKTDLVRELVDAADLATVLAWSPRTVAEFVVNLQVWATYDARDPATPTAPPSVPPDENPADDIGNWPGVADEADRFNLSPHRIRGLNILLATRSSREDPDFHLAVDLPTDSADRIAADRTWFNAQPEAGVQQPTYARVTTLIARVETPNLRREDNR